METQKNRQEIIESLRIFAMDESDIIVSSQIKFKKQIKNKAQF